MNGENKYTVEHYMKHWYGPDFYNPSVSLKSVAGSIF